MDKKTRSAMARILSVVLGAGREGAFADWVSREDVFRGMLTESILVRSASKHGEKIILSPEYQVYYGSRRPIEERIEEMLIALEMKENGDSPEVAKQLIALLRRREIPLRSLLGFSRGTDGSYEICTTQGTIHTQDFIEFVFEGTTMRRSLGRNVTGHYLPPVSTRRR